jgi:hypothetical protein
MGYDGVDSWNKFGWSIHANGAAETHVIGVEDLPPIEQLKINFLNRWFFLARTIAYFAVWGFMAWYFFRNSLRQDVTGDKRLTLRMQRFSAPMIILFTAALVFAAFDLEMSLEPMWFSTMFPVYFFAGAALGAFATIALAALLLQKSGRITDEVTVEHYHDLAKLMSSFIVFWGYIAFCQFMLIWYANIPEETFWYDWRINKQGWMTWSLILLFGHLLIPLLGLMARTVRRSKRFLFFATIYLLVMHYVDHYWLVMPQLHDDHRFDFSVLRDVPCALGLMAIFIAMFCLIARDRPLVPLQDPRLRESLNHVVH